VFLTSYRFLNQYQAVKLALSEHTLMVGGQHCQNDSGEQKKRGVSMPGIGGQDERNGGSACSGIYRLWVRFSSQEQ